MRKQKPKETIATILLGDELGKLVSQLGDIESCDKLFIIAVSPTSDRIRWRRGDKISILEAISACEAVVRELWEVVDGRESDDRHT